MKMKKYAIDRNKKNEAYSTKFDMPDCTFCATCGSCIYYSQVGWNGYCDFHKKRVSSSDTACGSYA